MLAENLPHEIAVTPWTDALCDVAKKFISQKGLIVDLGAGRRAAVSRFILELNPDATILAVEPFEEVDAPTQFKIVIGDIQDIEKKSASLILFNPPATPTRFLDEADYRFHQFHGGSEGNNILNDSCKAFETRLTNGGSALIVCPSYFPLPPAGTLKISVEKVTFESPSNMLQRSPVRLGQFEAAEAWIAQSVEENNAHWNDIGVKNKANKFAIVVLKIAA